MRSTVLSHAPQVFYMDYLRIEQHLPTCDSEKYSVDNWLLLSNGANIDSFARSAVAQLRSCAFEKE